jgi:hypothetical protein
MFEPNPPIIASAVLNILTDIVLLAFVGPKISEWLFMQMAEPTLTTHSRSADYNQTEDQSS